MELGAGDVTGPITSEEAVSDIGRLDIRNVSDQDRYRNNGDQYPMQMSLHITEGLTKHLWTSLLSIWKHTNCAAGWVHAKPASGERRTSVSIGE
ncbi:hypothetical protein PMO01_17375 [Pseudomonas moraviensis R28-S]|uniref:Uncharacterized protein n=1 Tax=Pseudomonas moraviensis R28-S TaxID=1395516 RepID=V8R4K8_9PSED|nr:hypothetical protein PMO01_17375 [Pseudomonas moraviensis R28-S]